MSIRSLLVTPPLKREIFQKAVASSADALLIELEDGVHRDRKVEARVRVAEFLSETRHSPRAAVIRTNDVLSIHGQDDLTVLARAGAAALMLPKVRNISDLELADAVIKRAETDAGRPINDVKLWLMIETTEAVLAAQSLVAHPRVDGVLMGSGDLSAELFVRKVSLGADRAVWDFPMELLYAKQHTLLAARSVGITAIDTGVTNFRDEAATRHAALVASQMGFDGTLVLSPRQIPVVHDVFTPTPVEYHWATRVIEMLQAADAAGETVAVLDGEMIEGPLVRNALTIVRRFERARQTDDAAIVQGG